MGGKSDEGRVKTKGGRTGSAGRRSAASKKVLKAPPPGEVSIPSSVVEPPNEPPPQLDRPTGGENIDAPPEVVIAQPRSHASRFLPLAIQEMLGSPSAGKKPKLQYQQGWWLAPARSPVKSNQVTL